MNLHRYRAPYLDQPRHVLANAYLALSSQLARDHAREPGNTETEYILRETLQDLHAHIGIPRDTRNLVVLERKTGFFSLVLIVLSYLALAEKRALALNVHFGRNCLYAAPDAPPDANAWDNFFEPLAYIPHTSLPGTPGANPARALLEKHCDISPIDSTWITRRNPALVLSPGRIDEHNRGYLSALLLRYIRPLPHILAAVDAFVTRHDFARRPVIGIHLRGGEHDTELAYFRLARRPISDTHAAIARQLARHPDARIFLATDHAAILAEFRARYTSRLITTEAQRANEPNASLHLGARPKVTGPQLGTEVLIEALLLSRTTHLVHGISNVATAACYFNPALPHTNIYETHYVSSRLAYEIHQFRTRTHHRLRLLKLRVAR